MRTLLYSVLNEFHTQFDCLQHNNCTIQFKLLWSYVITLSWNQKKKTSAFRGENLTRSAGLSVGRTRSCAGMCPINVSQAKPCARKCPLLLACQEFCFQNALSLDGSAVYFSD